MSELKPCPFCGGAAEFERMGDHSRSCIIACTDCSTRHETGEVGAKCGDSWNRRTPQPVTPAGGEVEEEARRLFELNSQGWKKPVSWLDLHEQTRELWHAFALRRLSHQPAADAALARDAERYRWLRDIENSDEAVRLLSRFIGTDLDNCVDAALNQRGGARGQ